MPYKVLLIIIFLLSCQLISSQSFLKKDGTRIVSGDGNEVLLRGLGTGNWMLMEGYMMKTAGIAGTQHEIRDKLEEIIGIEKTDSFFNAWLSFHFTKADVDSMKAWGFNSVRVAMHYKWFTLPIEEEAVPGMQTWLDKGFIMMDSLLSWCASNGMYLMLDMHGTPGGQGKNADISDYDPSKPSLWENVANQDKLVELWEKLALRYKDEVWIGGYDLINETNWDFEDSGNENGLNCILNIPLLELQKRIIDSIRAVDTNHMVFVSGNGWGNNYNGMNSLAYHDDNLAFTFHKYWNTNNDDDLNWIINKSKALNVPLWLSESGENSNTWFTEAIALSEKNGIGWSWWPVKKNGINNVLKVKLNDDYKRLVDYWKNPGNNTKPTEDEAFQAVLTWASNHKIENCEVAYDVIDAMIRQVQTDTVKPFKKHVLGEPIYFTDYDLGRNGIAYSDKYYANYGGEWTGWNNGWEYRNDGVDIEACSDQGAPNNGYNIGWTEDGDWMQYSLTTDSAAAYTLKIRHASGAGGSDIRIIVNDIDVSGKLSLSSTGGWQTYQYSSYDNIVLPAGDVKIKVKVENGGSNLNHLLFINPQSVINTPFQAIAAETAKEGEQIRLTLNKELSNSIDDIQLSEFEVLADASPIGLTSLEIDVDSKYILVLNLSETLYSDNDISLSYRGESIFSGSTKLEEIANMPVAKNMAESIRVPGLIEAEDFLINNGFVLEDCQDSGGGKNTAFANSGDYLVYKVHVTKKGEYRIAYRVATERNYAQLVFQVDDGNSISSLDTISFESTGGWQNWDVQLAEVYLNEGYYNIRLFVKQGEHNLNWFRLINTGTDIHKNMANTGIRLFPNPSSTYLNIEFKDSDDEIVRIDIYTLRGETVKTFQFKGLKAFVDISNLSAGVYYVNARTESMRKVLKLIKI